MKIYFDGVLIDPDFYTQLNQTNLLFSEKDVFTLNRSVCKSLTLGIDKEYISSMPTNVNIKINNNDFGHFIIDNVEEDDFQYIFTITDKMINFMFNYDASILINQSNHMNDSGVKYITLLELLQDMCSIAGVQLENSTFIGADKQISWYDNSISARNYIEMIAELNGGYALINKSGKLEIRQFQTTNIIETINIDECDSFLIGEEHKISRVVYDNGIVIYESGQETYDTIYIDSNNVFITEQSDIDNIYNVVNGLNFYSFKTNNCPINSNLDTGDCIAFSDGENIYKTFAQFDVLYNGGWIGGYCLDVATNKQAETELIDNEKNIKSIKTRLNRDEAMLEILSEQTVKISTSKESPTGTISFENIADSEPYKLTVKPTSENISYLYFNDNVFFDDTLFFKDRKIRFKNTTTNEIVDFEIPCNLLIYDNNTYDEFSLDLASKKCIVNKKVGYTANGTTYALNESRTIEYTYPTIHLTEGNYEISVPGYTCYISAELMLKNKYTDQTASKVEVEASIKQKADEINLEVGKKVNETELINKINVSTEAIIIKGNRFILDADNIHIDEYGNITLSNGAKIIGGDGLLSSIIVNSNLISQSFVGASILLPMGYSPAENSSVKDRLEFNFTIPKGFIPIGAYITINHMPAVYKYNGTTQYTGYSRNLQLYKSTNYSSGQLEYDRGYFTIKENIKYQKIDNAFGSGFTGSSSGYTKATSIDIKNYLDYSDSEDKLNVFKIETGNNVVSGDEIYKQSGACNATLQIYGYSKFE